MYLYIYIYTYIYIYALYAIENISTMETDDKPVDFEAPCLPKCFAHAFDGGTENMPPVRSASLPLAHWSCPDSTAATLREHPWEILAWKVSTQFIPVVFHDFLPFAHASCIVLLSLHINPQFALYSLGPL